MLVCFLSGPPSLSHEYSTTLCVSVKYVALKAKSKGYRPWILAGPARLEAVQLNLLIVHRHSRGLASCALICLELLLKSETIR